jgi:type II secretory pathway component GspD/PulD (secretin)
MKRLGPALQSLLTITSISSLALVAVLSPASIAHAASAEALEKTDRAPEKTQETAPSSQVKIPFHFDNVEILAMIAAYAKASGKKFIVDPGVRGKVSVFLPSDVSLDEAYNILMESLSINGFTIIEEGDTNIVKSARNAQRDGIPTLTKLPPVKPNRMLTMIFTLKYAPVEQINMRLRILPSKDGEMTPFEPTNSLIVSDYAANINRIADVLALLDTPAAAKWKVPQRPNQNQNKNQNQNAAPGDSAPPKPYHPSSEKGHRTSSVKMKSSKYVANGDELDRPFED